MALKSFTKIFIALAIKLISWWLSYLCYKSEITATRRDDLEDSTVEGLWLEISLPKTHGFLIGTFYRPPNSSKYHDKDFMVKLESILYKATSEDKKLFILGDFNCDFLIKRSSIAECKQLKSLFKSFHIKQVINEAMH